MKLSKKETAKLIKNWNIGNLISYKKSEKGESNHNWIIKSTEGKFILRRAPNFSKIKDLKSELLYLNKLKQSNFPYSVPEPLKISNGNNLIKYKKGNWWLYKYIEGKIVEPLSLQKIS